MLPVVNGFGEQSSEYWACGKGAFRAIAKASARNIPRARVDCSSSAEFGLLLLPCAGIQEKPLLATAALEIKHLHDRVGNGVE